ncbi:hypothetical protein JW865_09395 [Candidatus Bathyarchaeota archaeon]|nr:hypothetical protein [Candidatus Bathyarchaeota archaeon]
MSDTISIQTLDSVVNKALLTLPENQRSLSNRDRFLEFAIDALRNLRLTTTNSGAKTVKIEPNAVNRFDFPYDMEQFISLGVPVNGKIWWLTRNNDIINTKTVIGIDESLDEDDGEGIDLAVSQSDSFDSIGGINSQGYFTLDFENREIIVNANTRSELLLRYISSGINNSGETYIESKYIRAIIAYILWMDVDYDRTAPMNMKEQYKSRFEESKNEIKRIEAPGLWELLDAWNSKSMNS